MLDQFDKALKRGKSESKEIFLDIVNSDEYLANFADGPTFAKKFAENRDNYVNTCKLNRKRMILALK